MKKVYLLVFVVIISGLWILANTQEEKKSSDIQISCQDSLFAKTNACNYVVEELNHYNYNIIKSCGKSEGYRKYEAFLMNCSMGILGAEWDTFNVDNGTCLFLNDTRNIEGLYKSNGRLLCQRVLGISLDSAKSQNELKLDNCSWLDFDIYPIVCKQEER